MESKVRLLGHPVHQMLVVFPLGLLATSVVFDFFGRIGDSQNALDVCYALIGAGLVGALLAAPFGTIDWLAIPRGTRARRIGALHGGGNLVVVVLFALSFWLRRGVEVPPVTATVLSTAGAGLALVTGWLGGELVDRLGVGISDNASLDARSSLDGPATP
jgi:uncharacterized membrane protein